MTEATATPAKVAIRPNIANMVKTKGGSYHKDDFIGTTLNGLTVSQVKVIATECGLDVSKYAHLNPGQQRMTLGNSLRKLTNMVDETGLEAAALDKAVEANKVAESVRDQIEELADSMRGDLEAANAAKEDEKAAKKAAAAEAKAAKAAAKKAKVGDDPAGEGNAE